LRVFDGYDRASSEEKLLPCFSQVDDINT
jgi:hypothetical protein